MSLRVPTSVENPGESLPEGVHGLNLAAVGVQEQRGVIGVEHQPGDAGNGHALDVDVVPEVLRVAGLHRQGVKLTRAQGFPGGGVVGERCHAADVGLVHAQVLFVVVTIPIPVSLQEQLGFRVEARQCVRPAGGGGLHGGPVGACDLPAVILGGLARLEQRRVDQKAVGQGVGEGKGRVREGGLQDEVQSMVVHLHQPHVLPGDRGSGLGDEEVLPLVGLVGHALGQTGLIQLLCGSPRRRVRGVLHAGVEIGRCVIHGDIPRRFVAVPVGRAGHVPKVHVQAEVQARLEGGGGVGLQPLIGHLTGLHVAPGVQYGQRVAEGIGTAVPKPRVQQPPQAVYIVVGGNIRRCRRIAVFFPQEGAGFGGQMPSGIGIQGDPPGQPLVARLYAHAARVLRSDVLRQRRRQFRYQRISRALGGGQQTVQPRRQQPRHLPARVAQRAQRVPLKPGQAVHRGAVGIDPRVRVIRAFFSRKPFDADRAAGIGLQLDRTPAVDPLSGSVGARWLENRLRHTAEGQRQRHQEQ